MRGLSLVKILRWVYLGIFLIGFSLIVLLHIFPKPFLDIIRMPTFIRAAEPFLGFPYDPSLHVYQITLLFFLVVTLIDGVSLFLSSSTLMKKISAAASFVGFALIGLVGFYFLYSLVIIGMGSVFTKTVFIYLLLCFSLFILDLFTFWIDENLIHHLPVRSPLKLENLGKKL